MTRSGATIAHLGRMISRSLVLLVAACGGDETTGLSDENPIPSVRSISPEAVFTGHDGFILTIRGADFLESSVVRWNGSERATTFVGATTLRAAIPASDVATAGSLSITVFNPPPGGGVSDTRTLSVLQRPVGQIVFVSGRDGNSEIFVMNADGTGVVNLTNDPADDSNPAWSPDGSRIAFVSDREGNRDVYVMNADGTGVVNLTNNPADDWRTGAIDDWAPSWSPDGSRILFATDRDGNDEIYVMNQDGSGQTNLSNRAERDWRPGWSPDGSAIVWTTAADPGNWEIYAMKEDGSSQVNLTHTAGSLDTGAMWSPDGSKIAFSSTRNEELLGEVYVMNADGSSPVTVSRSSTDDLKPAWSPDGNSIAFIGHESAGGWFLFVVEPDGTNKMKLGHGWPSRQPAWSPDGLWIANTSADSGDDEIFLTDVEGLHQLNLTNSAGPDSGPSWKPQS